MSTFLTILHVFLCLFLIAVVLLQSGRSGGMGVLSGGASQQVFGGRGAGNFLQKITTGVAFMFLATCTALGYFSSSTQDRGLNSDSTAVASSDAGAMGDASAASDARAASTNTSLTPPATPTAVPAEPAVEPRVEPSGDAGEPSAAAAAVGSDS